MCGIVGFVNTKDGKADIIEEMMARIVHRGPSSAGKFVDDKVALGFRRLSIIDLAGGSQPIFNEDHSKVIIFNGEIYNFQWVPLLDIEMMNLAQTIPTKYLINQNNTKDVFRQAAKRHLPKEWANREKLGFPVPIKSWLKEETGYTAVKTLFAADFAAEFFDQAAILQMLDDHRKNQVNLQRKIWTIFTFLTWYKVFFIDQEIPQSQQIIYETIV